MGSHKPRVLWTESELQAAREAVAKGMTVREIIAAGLVHPSRTPGSVYVKLHMSGTPVRPRNWTADDYAALDAKDWATLVKKFTPAQITDKINRQKYRGQKRRYSRGEGKT